MSTMVKFTTQTFQHFHHHHLPNVSQVKFPDTINIITMGSGASTGEGVCTVEDDRTEEEKTAVQIGHDGRKEIVRAFGSKTDILRCKIYDKIYTEEVQAALCDTSKYEALTFEEKAFQFDKLRKAGIIAHQSILTGKGPTENIEEGDEEAEEAVADDEIYKPLQYKADITLKIASLPENTTTEDKVIVMDHCQQVIVASWVAATKLQAIMRGRKERNKKGKGKKKGGGKKKK